MIYSRKRAAIFISRRDEFFELMFPRTLGPDNIYLCEFVIVGGGVTN